MTQLTPLHSSEMMSESDSSPEYFEKSSVKVKRNYGFTTPPPKQKLFVSSSPTTNDDDEDDSFCHSLSFQSFPDALPKVCVNTPVVRKKIRATPMKGSSMNNTTCGTTGCHEDEDENTLISSTFPNLSPVAPMSPTYCRHVPEYITESPFHEDTSTLSVNSSFSRPLPDQSAFDTSMNTSIRSSPQRKSPVCPPTPVRQPNWAHDAPSVTPGNLSRHSSLKSSKVLLTLPNFGNDDKMMEGYDDCLFKDFETLGWIGSGSFADVLKMRSKADGQIYAVKKSKRQFRSKRDRSNFIKEIRTYETFASRSPRRCENIIQYYSAWQEEGHTFIQTELCDSGNLGDFIDTIRHNVDIPESTIWYIAHQISRGLAFIHDAGIVHLDIKPLNIFVSSTGVLKIGDFGAAAEVGSVDDDSEGDTFYMAKELLRCKTIHPSADIFSLGILLYELATGYNLPSDGDFWHELRSGQGPRIPSKYSDDLEVLIRMMMNQNPKLRPTAHDILSFVNKRKNDGVDPFVLSYVSRSTAPLCPETPRIVQKSSTSTSPMTVASPSII